MHHRGIVEGEVGGCRSRLCRPVMKRYCAAGRESGMPLAADGDCRVHGPNGNTMPEDRALVDESGAQDEASDARAYSGDALREVTIIEMPAADVVPPRSCRDLPGCALLARTETTESMANVSATHTATWASFMRPHAASGIH